MAIAKGKKRYSITLTPTYYERFQVLARDLGMPKGIMSAALDDTLKGLCEVFQTAKDTGGFTINDMFRMMGSQMTQLVDEERREASDQNRKKAPRRSTIAKA